MKEENIEKLEAGKKARALQKTWQNELSASNRDYKRFRDLTREVGEAYKFRGKQETSSKHLLNLFKVNINTQRDSIYSAPPKPVASRVHGDSNDVIGLVACQIIERAMVAEYAQSASYDIAFEDIVLDYLMFSLGVGRVHYFNSYDQQAQNSLSDSVDDEVAALPEADPVLKDQRTPISHVNIEDIRWNSCRTEDEVRWIAQRVYLTQEEFEAQFPNAEPPDDEDQDEVNSPKSDNPAGPQHMAVHEIPVWEIWDKTSLKVYFLREGATQILDVREDFYNLPDFFPFVFMMGTKDNTLFEPVPEYVDAQYQYKQLNTLTERIHGHIEAAKVVGFYDPTVPGLKDLIDDAIDGEIFPLERYMAFLEKGGGATAVTYLDVSKWVSNLQMLSAQRNDIKQQIYEITGISDIIRGATSPYETKGAQQMKASFASGRMQAKGRVVAKAFSQLFKKKADLMVKFYEPERLVQRAGNMMPASMQLVPQALELLKDELMDFTRIEVSADTLQQQDMAMDKQEAVEALGAISNVLTTALPLAQTSPEFMPIMLEAVKLTASRFRGARNLESTIDAQLERMAGQQPGDSPQAKEAAAAQAKEQAEQQRMAAEKQAQVAMEQAKAQEAIRAKEIEAANADKQAERAHQLKVAELKLKELEANQKGIDTSEIGLSIGDANPSMRATKEEVAQMIVQSNAQNMQMMQSIMQGIAGMMQSIQQSQAQMVALLSEPMPPAEVTIKNADGSVKFSGKIE